MVRHIKKHKHAQKLGLIRRVTGEVSLSHNGYVLFPGCVSTPYRVAIKTLFSNKYRKNVIPEVKK